MMWRGTNNTMEHEMTTPA